MPRYRYEASNDAGKAFRGVLTTTSAAAATTQLESQGLRVRSVTLDDRQLGEAEAPMAVAVDRLRESRDGLAEPVSAFADEFARGRRRRELQAIADRMTEGDRETLLAAAGDDPAAWSALLAATAEHDGAQSSFARFVERETTASEVIRRRSLALAYPLFLAALCLAVAWAFSVVVLPTFSAIFRDFGLELPGLTLLVLAIGNFLAGGGAVFLLGLTLIAAVLWMTYPGWAPRRLRSFLQRFTGLRRVSRSLSNARLANHLANLLEAGMPIPAGAALIDADGVGDAPSGRRPPSAVIAYAASDGLSPATRTRLLRTFAVNSNEAAAEVEDSTLGMAGPLSVFALGFLVAFCVIALFMPLVKLIEGLS